MEYSGTVTPDFILALIVGLLTITCKVLAIWQNERTARRAW